MYGTKKLAIKKFSFLPQLTNFGKYPRQVADVNGDSRADIVGFADNAVYVSLGQSNGTFSEAFIARNDNFTVKKGKWTCFNKYPRQLADVNGDDRADIIGFANNAVYVSLGQSNGTFGEAFVAKNDDFTVNKGGWTSFDKYPRQLADINGDGRADIIGLANNAVYVSLGQSNGTFGEAFVAKNDDFTVNKGGWTSFDKYPRQLADINGDGRADIIGLANNAVYVSLGQSNGTFGEAFVAKNDDFTVNKGGWTSFDKYPRQLADVNGDGRADIVGFGYDNVFVSLGQSNGTFSETFVVSKCYLGK
ncbi:VCBS repeat-containing protein [Nostoc flagelliforme FACHB-838]|uniref:VCBS repeat-containing protein n=1 Tax=Nostoc flagelliforme FACHB-838 TaxID=2692904 RepID=A0ABR8DTS1_9NOSO|nr:VCBS repeat-containing protein [Nostoc flagelliforme]MBD2532847.1 VCBS repeat-containing protein [Nostoc flagelliforme FACHB-838]